LVSCHAGKEMSKAMNSPELWASMLEISTARLAMTRGVCRTTKPFAASAGRVASIRELRSAYFV
jgi:predicted outer membrane protein